MKRSTKKWISLFTSLVMMLTIAGTAGTVSAVSKDDPEAAAEPAVTAEQQAGEEIAAPDQDVQEPAAEPEAPAEEATLEAQEGLITLTATLEDTQAVLNWNELDPTYHYAITSQYYDYQTAADPQPAVTVVDESAEFTDETFTVTDLNKVYCNSYTFTVTAYGEDHQAIPDATGTCTVKFKIPEPPEVDGVETMAGYKKVTLKWDAIGEAPEGLDAVFYRIFVNDKLVKKIKVKSAKKSYTYVVDKINKKALQEGKTYKFYVRPVYRKDTPYHTDPSTGGTYELNIGSKTKSVKDGPIRPAYFIAKVKSSGWAYTTYKGHSKAKYYKAGQTIKAYGAMGGRYMIKKGSKTIYFSTDKCKNARAQYDSSEPYTKAEKEAYVNDRKLTSKTSSLFWVNTYTQQANWFKKSGGKWKLVAVYNCSTGKASTPTPTGRHKVWNKLRSRHGIPYWTVFYAYTGFHKKPANTIGRPASGGCVRLELEAARTLYNTKLKGSAVFVY